jgi:hypothetical protein
VCPQDCAASAQKRESTRKTIMLEDVKAAVDAMK